MNKLNKIINSECKHKPYRDKDNKCWYCKECENYLGDKSLNKKELGQ